MIALIPCLSETMAYLSPKENLPQPNFAQVLDSAQGKNQPPPPPPPAQYVVQAGDHLWGIAKKLGYPDPQELARFNRLKDPDRLQIGQVLQLPPTDPSTIVARRATAPSPAKKRLQNSLPKEPSSPSPSLTPAEKTTASVRPQTSSATMVLASWYGNNHHGKLMANGQPFDMYADTVAHRHLPLGTRLRLTNLKNGRSVVVQVTDRGPFVPRRSLDLSYGAAHKLGIVKPGVSRLLMEQV